MKMKKTMVFIMAFLLVLSTASCINTYKSGVEFPDFPEKDVPIYDDAVVFEYEGDDEESEIVYGTEDDVDDVMDFYKDEFEDEDYIIVDEKEDKDEYEVEGYIDDIHFEIQAEEASGEEKEYFDCIVTISVEIVDEDEVEEAKAKKIGEIAEEEASEPIAVQATEPAPQKTEELVEATPAPTEEPAVEENVPDVLKVMLRLPYSSSDISTDIDSLRNMLAEELGMEVELEMSDDYERIIIAMQAGEAHMGMLAGVDYVKAVDSGGVEVILKALRYDTDEFGTQLFDAPLVSGYSTELLVHKDSGIMDVSDLAGKKIAVPNYTSLSCFVWPANFLADNGIDPETDVEWINVGGYDTTILALMNGEVDAAFTFVDSRTIFFSQDDNYEDIIETCVFLTRTPPVPTDTYCVVPQLGEGFKERLQQAFINIIATEEGYRILNGLYFHEGYAPATYSDYDQTRLYLARKEEWNFD